MNANPGRPAAWLVRSVRDAGWAPLSVVAIHALAWLGLDAYSRFPSLDVPMHFMGGVAIAYFFHRAALLAPVLGVAKATDDLTHGVLVFGLTCAAAVFWEFAEFAMDSLFGTHTQRGLEDTMGDMAMGILGGLVLLAGARRFRVRNASEDEYR